MFSKVVPIQSFMKRALIAALIALYLKGDIARKLYKISLRLVLKTTTVQEWQKRNPIWRRQNSTLTQTFACWIQSLFCQKQSKWLWVHSTNQRNLKVVMICQDIQSQIIKLHSRWIYKTRRHQNSETTPTQLLLNTIIYSWIPSLFLVTILRNM